MIILFVSKKSRASFHCRLFFKRDCWNIVDLCEHSLLYNLPNLRIILICNYYDVKYSYLWFLSCASSMDSESKCTGKQNCSSTCIHHATNCSSTCIHHATYCSSTCIHHATYCSSTCIHHATYCEFVYKVIRFSSSYLKNNCCPLFSLQTISQFKRIS